ncbi:MAG: outer membrane beta-barrel protein [Verrucomicrobiales bacterium]
MIKYQSIALVLAIAPFSAVVAGEPAAPAPPPPVVTTYSEPDSGWFVGVKGGALWVEDLGYTRDTGIGSVQIDTDFDIGWGATVPFGYRLGNGFSIGASVGYYTADLNRATVRLDGENLGKLSLDADPAVVPILANAAYSFSLTDALTLTVGAGIGVAWSEFDLDRIESIRYDASFDGWNLSFQGFSGFNYSVNESTEITLGYRYIHSETDEDAIQGHNLEAGVVIRF